ncbi:putative large multi-functional protein [Blastopirellula marina DSM 3645]|uniref:Putative large multi-functional protein n=2 Tax=Blastopirellula marina TaxID=124 RepID=A3ZPX1_9BACT|nr:putative large multi-functional protein [Blastopirellula marina DSM 3645]
MLRNITPLFVLMFLSSLCLAAEQDPRVFVDPDNVNDPDFVYQGEFYGPLRLPNGSYEMTGLQVVALGDGKFSALQYKGGLPGNGWDNGPKLALQGEMQSGLIQLQHDAYTIAVDPNHAVVINTAGQQLGDLPKVRRKSLTLGHRPPHDARVLFDGTSTEFFRDGKLTADGLLKAGTITTFPVSDFQLHLEFRTPYMPDRGSQARGNSGVYIQERYEVQILDSFGKTPEFNDSASIYRTKPPEMNMCFPPLQWQTYDIYFNAARFDDAGDKVSDARLTVFHNGIAVQRDVRIPNKTGAGKKEGAEPMPIKLQDHKDPVVFRNIWIIEPSAPMNFAAETCVCR